MTPNQILAAFHRGELSLEQAIQALADYSQTPAGGSLSPEAALAKAKGFMDRETDVSEQTPSQTVDPSVGAPAGAGALPSFQGLGAEIQSPFENDQTTALDAVLGNRFPRGGGPVEDVFRDQARAILPAFGVLKGLGDLPAGASVFDFLSRNLGQSNIDPGFIAQRAGSLLGENLNPLDPTQTVRSGFQQQLLESPSLQRSIALAAQLQRVPASIAPAIRSQFNKEFGQFQTGVPIDPLTNTPDFAGNPFLPFFNQQRSRR